MFSSLPPSIERCLTPADSELWGVAYQIALRELVRGGKDGNPAVEAERFVNAQRTARRIYSSSRLVDENKVEVQACQVNWSTYACLAQWFAHLDSSQRNLALQNIASDQTPWGCGSCTPPTVWCGPTEKDYSTCCPSYVRDDPAYTPSGVKQFYQTPQPQPQSHTMSNTAIASWLIAFAAMGTFLVAFGNAIAARRREQA